MSIRMHVASLLGAMWLMACQSLGAEVAGDRPNMIVILVDDLGFGDLSSQGASDLRTPHIDRLMAHGMRLDQFYANCPVCSPTRASLLSGCYPDRVGVPGVIRTHAQDSWGYLDPTAHLLPELLHEAGYHTALVGKWHLGLESPNTPNERGFDTFHGFLGDMMDDYYNHQRHGRNYMRLNQQPIEPKGHATDLFARWASDYLVERAGSDQPFFLYLAFNAPHTPIQPPDAWLTKVTTREPQLAPKRAALAALIEHLDAAIGEVVATLERSGQAERTVIVFTSDNGGQLNVGAHCGPLRGGKQDMYEGGIKVPACVVWPGHIQAGHRNEDLLMTMDLYPTLAAAAGITLPHSVDGVSFLPALLGQAGSFPERDMVWVRREGNMRYQGRAYYALRRGNWKLLQPSPFAPYELYDLEADPLEAHNLASSQPNPFKSLVQSLQRHLQRAGRVPWQAPSREGLPAQVLP